MERDDDTGMLKAKQAFFTNKIIEYLGLDVGNKKVNWMPVEGKTLVKDKYLYPTTLDFRYSSVVGMIMYLAGHFCPYIVYAVNCAVGYILFPKHFNELALKTIGLYLKATRNRGLLINISP